MECQLYKYCTGIFHVFVKEEKKALMLHQHTVANLGHVVLKYTQSRVGTPGGPNRGKTMMVRNKQAHGYFVDVCRVEGRSWYTSHRGCLWIAAAAKRPTPQEITQVEDMYRQLYKKGTGPVVGIRAPQSNTNWHSQS